MRNLEIQSNKERVSYKIFSDIADLELYREKNKDKSCVNMCPVFSLNEYKEYPQTQVRKLTSEEIRKYMGTILCKTK